jgi:hypothetical protein
MERAVEDDRGIVFGEINSIQFNSIQFNSGG